MVLPFKKGESEWESWGRVPQGLRKQAEDATPTWLGWGWVGRGEEERGWLWPGETLAASLLLTCSSSLRGSEARVAVAWETPAHLGRKGEAAESQEGGVVQEVDADGPTYQRRVFVQQVDFFLGDKKIKKEVDTNVKTRKTALRKHLMAHKS